MCWKRLTNGLLAVLFVTQVGLGQTRPQPVPSAVQSLTGNDQYVRPSATAPSGPVLALDSVLIHIDQSNPLLKPSTLR